MEALSPESRALRRSNVVFKRGVDPDNLVTVLYSNFLLTPEEKAKATQRTLTDDEKLELIFTTLERRVSVKPDEFRTLVQALQDEPATVAVAEKIQAKYDEELAKATKNGTGASSASPKQAVTTSPKTGSEQNAGGTRTPTMKELIKNVNVADWSKFAIFLIDENKVPTIDRDHLRIDKKLEEVFRIFLEENDTKPTWNAVVEALEDMNQKRLAQTIREKFCQ